MTEVHGHGQHRTVEKDPDVLSSSKSRKNSSSSESSSSDTSTDSINRDGSISSKIVAQRRAKQRSRERQKRSKIDLKSCTRHESPDRLVDRPRDGSQSSKRQRDLDQKNDGENSRKRFKSVSDSTPISLKAIDAQTEVAKVCELKPKSTGAEYLLERVTALEDLVQLNKDTQHERIRDAERTLKEAEEKYLRRKASVERSESRLRSCAAKVKAVGPKPRVETLVGAYEARVKKVKTSRASGSKKAMVSAKKSTDEPTRAVQAKSSSSKTTPRPQITAETDDKSESDSDGELLNEFVKHIKRTKGSKKALRFLSKALGGDK